MWPFVTGFFHTVIKPPPHYKTCPSFLWLNNIPLISIPHLVTYSSVYRHFHTLPIMNNVFINIPVQVSVFSQNTYVFNRVEKAGSRVTLCLTFWGPENLICTAAAPFTLPSVVWEPSNGSPPFPTLATMYLLDCSHPRQVWSGISSWFWFALLDVEWC